MNQFQNSAGVPNEPQLSALRRASRDATNDLAAAEAALREEIALAKKEFVFTPSPEAMAQIEALTDRRRAAVAQAQRVARARADQNAIPNSKHWRMVYDEVIAKQIASTDEALEKLKSQQVHAKKRAFLQFAVPRVRDADARVVAAKACRQSARDSAVAEFKAVLRANYPGSKDDLFVAPADDGLAEELRAVRREHVRTWARTRLAGLEIDDEQADAVGVIDRHVRLTARAGSGKTRTLTARAAFLIDRCGVDPSEVLLLAFNRKAASEMATRLQEFGIDCPQVLTFHAFARAIVRPSERILTDDDREPERAGRITQIIQRWIESDLGTHRVRDVMLRYYRSDWEKIFFAGTVMNKSAALEHLRRSVPNETLDGKQVKSFGEKVIANFLFEHDVPYKYEPFHRWNGDVYRPDFEVTGRNLVIEYFGLSRDHEYQRMMADKRHFWKSKGWTLLEYDPDSLHGDVGSALPIALEEDLVRMGVRLRRRSDEELWEARGRQLRLSISRLISQLIGRCRKASLSPEDLSRRLQKHNPVDPIEADVLGLLSEAYSAYLETLRKNEEEDFEGLLQRSISMVRSGAWEFGRRDLRGDVRRIRHVLVDEFQDVAPLFWELVEAVRGVCAQDAKVFGVGDDWQAINGFAGSSPRFLQNFALLLQPSAVLGLLTNYRSSCAVIDAGNAIMSGQGAPARPVARAPRGQALLADLGGFEPSVLETHHWRGDRVTPALRRLIAGPVAEGRTVAVLARQRFTPYPMSDRAIGFNNGPVDSPSDLDRLRRLVCEGMDAKSRERVLFDTVHAFKGREADYVVVLDAVEGRFPKVHPDWVFGRVLGDSLESLLEDERRLFYVGCSRAASTLVILTEGSRKCSFLPEIESKFTALRWDFLRPACPRDGDWLMMIDGAEGEGSEPTFQRRDALKARGFSYFGSDAGGVWHLRFPGDMNVAEISAKIPKALWFPGPAGLRIRLMHGDGLVAAEFIVASDQSVDGGLRLAPRYVGR